MITSEAFFHAWMKVVDAQREKLLPIWNKPTQFTSAALYNDDALVYGVAEELKLSCYASDYYYLDAIFYRPEKDLWGSLPDHNFYFLNMEIAFEHENAFGKKLHAEIAHLLITRCNLRVLVTYPNYHPVEHLAKWHEEICKTDIADQISKDRSFLVIFGYFKGFTWEAWTFNKDNPAWDRVPDPPQSRTISPQ